MEDTELVGSIKSLNWSLLKFILEFGYTQVFHFYGVSNAPFLTDFDRRNVVDFLDKLKVSSSLQCLAFELQNQRLSILNL